MRIALTTALLIVSAMPALAQPAPAGAKIMGPNPSECEIQAALLGAAGPGCPALPLVRPPAPAPAQPSAAAPVQPVPRPVQVPPVPQPSAQAKPELRAAFRVEFDFNSARLRPESREILDRVAAVMTAPAAGKTRFRIVGHTDSVGSDAANLSLSQRRAAAVVEYLVERHHIAPARLEASGRGARELLLPDQPTAAANRRVEIVNLGE